MAGTARPENVKEEMTNYVIESESSSSAGILFDNKIVVDNYLGFFQWYGTFGGSVQSITITFNKPCNIWRYGRKGFTAEEKSVSISPQKYSKENDIEALEWSLWIENIQPGTYTFTGNQDAQRTDIEWYFEKTQSERIKAVVKETILNNELIQNHCLLSSYEE